ncbi:MAG: hypothetical protein HRU17_19240 [Polyangiaceae bacterium]|nr:hypothetical protein [Polyangiaceae bacterium]
MSAPFVSEDDTLVNADAECVVLVAGDAPALAACRSAAIKVASAPVEECEMKDVATHCAKFHPFAIVLDNSIYEFDPAEFDSLARDVGAQLVRIPTGELSGFELELMLIAALNEAHRHRYPSAHQSKKR